MYPDDHVFAAAPQQTSPLSSRRKLRVRPAAVHKQSRVALPTDDVEPPPYPGTPAPAYGFYRVVDDDIFITAGNPQRRTGDDAPSPSPSSGGSPSAAKLVRSCWITLFIAGILFVAGVATTGLSYSYSHELDFATKRQGMLMVFAAAVIVVIVAAVCVCKVIKHASSTTP